MKFLLTSSGISNPSISDALVDLLGKPISKSSALFIPTAIYPFPGGAGTAGQATDAAQPLTQGAAPLIARDAGPSWRTSRSPAFSGHATMAGCPLLRT